MTAPTTAIAERVAAGAAWLDANFPGWARQVDLGKLDLANCRRCVLGQLIGDYNDAPDWVWENALTLGFTALDLHDNDARDVDFDDLTDAWWDLITVRRAQVGAR